MNCRWNEEKVFPSLFETLDSGFVEARLHTDGDRGDELIEFEQQVAHSITTPLYLVLDPKNERVLAGPVGGIVTVDGFRAFLKEAQATGGREEKVGRLDEH